MNKDELDPMPPLSEHLYEAADSIEEPLFHQFVAMAIALEQENERLREALAAIDAAWKDAGRV